MTPLEAANIFYSFKSLHRMISEIFLRKDGTWHTNFPVWCANPLVGMHGNHAACLRLESTRLIPGIFMPMCLTFPQRLCLPHPQQNYRKPTLKTVQNLHRCFRSLAIYKLHGHRECERPPSPRVTSCSKRTQHQIHRRKPWPSLAASACQVTISDKQVKTGQFSSEQSEKCNRSTE